MRFRWLGREGALRHNTRSTVGMLWYCNLFWRIDGEDVVRFVVYGCQCVAGIAVRCGIGISLRGCEREVIWCREVRQGGDMLYPCIWEHKEGTRLATTRVLLKFCMRGTSTGSVVSYDNVDSIHDHADNENGNNKPRKAKPNLYLSFEWLGSLTPSKFEDDVCTLLRICILYLLSTTIIGYSCYKSFLNTSVDHFGSVSDVGLVAGSQVTLPLSGPGAGILTPLTTLSGGLPKHTPKYQ